jgi:integrase
MFKWGTENELVPPSVLQGLEAVSGLQKGRSAARETKPVKPVPLAFVNATLPHVLPQVAAMIQLQLVTGMRPGEVCIMRAIDLDTTGKVWLYRPGSDQEHGVHKTAHRGHHRIVPIGPQGQAILRPHLKTELYAYLFSPRDAMSAFRAGQRANRKSRVQPSQVNRQRRNPKKKLGDCYDSRSYAQAIAKGCTKAYPPPAPLARRENETRKEWKTRLTVQQKEELRAWYRLHHWHPHQLRHNKATEVRREHGLDAARALLGHRSPVVTEVYAELDLGKAIEVALKLG